jgi:hypothetical protein
MRLFAGVGRVLLSGSYEALKGFDIMGFEQWWLKELSESERTEILSTFQPMGGDSRLLIMSNKL